MAGHWVSRPTQDRDMRRADRAADNPAFAVCAGGQRSVLVAYSDAPVFEGSDLPRKVTLCTKLLYIKVGASIIWRRQIAR
jgi:hypothetical protein